MCATEGVRRSAANHQSMAITRTISGDFRTKLKTRGTTVKKIYYLIMAAVLGLVVTPTAKAASTDGTANFNVTFVNPPGGYNARVDAFWITDASNRFIKN